jgi:vacuolar-type H+-ATPase subunit E/Vma4
MTFKALLTLAAALTLGFTTTIAKDEDTPLTKEMTAMNKSLRMLKRQVADPAKKQDNLALVGKIKGNVDAALKLEPSKIKDVPAADKPAYLEKFRQQLNDLKKTYDDVEVALKADKQDEAKKLFEKLAEQKEKGHKDFGVDDE